MRRYARALMLAAAVAGLAPPGQAHRADGTAHRATPARGTQVRCDIAALGTMLGEEAERRARGAYRPASARDRGGCA